MPPEKRDGRDYVSTLLVSRVICRLLSSARISRRCSSQEEVIRSSWKRLLMRMSVYVVVSVYEVGCELVSVYEVGCGWREKESEDG